jgi:HEAT repeat protein
VANLNVSGLINTSNWSARSGLAKALKYVGGPGADEALLRLNADTDNDVRTAALDSIKTRPLNAGDLDVSSFINASNWSARAGLARALGFVGGHGADQALLRLNADTDNDVRTAALVSIEARPFDAANFNVSGLINSSNWSARAGLARALKSVTGQGANEALLRLNADTDNDVRTAALASITARPFDAGDFNVSSLINASNWSSRAGLARALRYVTGQKSINALITLVLDSDSDVRNAAQESLKAHGFGG